MKKLITFIFTLIIGIQLNAQLFVPSPDSSPLSCDCYTVTTPAMLQVGAIFSPSTINLNNNFNFSFQIYMGDEDFWGADGMVFVLQPNQAYNATAGAGNLGYLGTAPSLGIEIDTYQNPDAPQFDPFDDHIAFNSNGQINHNLAGPVTVPNLENNAFHTFQVIWDSFSQTMAVFLDGNFIVSYTGDIINDIFGGNPNVYFGFVGATGGLWNLQQVCMYRNANFSASQTTVCPNETINFTDLSTSDLNMITNWNWNFGDGATSTDQNPSHSFTTQGTYNVQLTITDITGCTDTENLNITVLPTVSINITETDITCFGLTNGELLATPTSGVGPYTFNWDIPFVGNNPTGLGVGTYEVTVVDLSNGCDGTAQGTISQPTSALSIDLITTVETSCGVSNGEIEINASGGTVNYQYSINGGVLQASNSFTGLASANYTVLVQDANGCQESVIVNVGQASLMQIDDITTTNVSCGAVPPDGTITVNVSNGTDPYNYSINGGPFQLGNVFNDLAPGNYTVQITDDNGCVLNDLVTVNSATAMTLDNILITNTSCNGLSDGSIEIQITGGDPVIQYSINGGTTFQASPIFNTLAPNTYNIIVEDGSGCIVFGVGTINEPTPLSIDNVILSQPVSCNGFNDAEIQILASGGNGVYTFSIDAGVTSQPNNTFSNLAPGNYTFTLFEGPLCSTNINGDITINQPDPIQVDNTIVTDVTCNGLNNGQIIINAIGGDGDYQYSLNGIVYQLSNTFSMLGDGDYIVEVIDGNGCPEGIANVTISESAPLTVSLSPDQVICSGSDIDICANVSGGTGPFLYFWNGITAVAGPNCITVNSPGTYTVEIEDANGCTSSVASQTIGVYPPLNLNVGNDATICPGDLAQIFAEASGGDGGPYLYTWTNNMDGTTLSGAFQNVFPNQSTIYTVTVSDACGTLPQPSLNVNINTHPTPNFDIITNVNEGCSPLNIQLFNNTDPLLVSSINWTFENNGTSITNNNEITYTEPGCYDVSLVINTINGCQIDTLMNDFICVYDLPIANFDYTPENPDLFNLNIDLYNTSSGAVTYEWFYNSTVSNEENISITLPEIGHYEFPVTLIAYSDLGCSDTITKLIYIEEIKLFFIPNAVTPDGNGINEVFQPVFIPGFNPVKYEIIIFNRWGEIMFQSDDINAYWDCTYMGKLVLDDTYTWQITFGENDSDKRFRYFGHFTLLK